MDQRGIVLRQPQADDVVIAWDKPINVLAWRFTVRGGRVLVPRGWNCLACRLVQGEAAMALYTFMPPERARLLDVWPAFDELAASRRRVLAGREPQRSPGESPHVAQLRMAERQRWQDGAELGPPDFQEVVGNIAARAEGWPPERGT